jgi:hypothetical protein
MEGVYVEKKMTVSRKNILPLADLMEKRQDQAGLVAQKITLY